MRRDLFAQVLFLLSFGFLALLYGHGAATYGWFPDRLIVRAISQVPGGSWERTPNHLYRRVHASGGVRIEQPGRMQPGLTLLSTWWADIGWGLKLVDRDGEVVHAWSTPPEVLFPDHPGPKAGRAVPLEETYPHGSYVFPDGDVIVNIEYVGTVRLDACGEPVWRLAEGGHHSVARAADGTFWIPTGEYAGEDGAGFRPDRPGFAGPVDADRVARVSADGELLEEIDLVDVLLEAGLGRYLAKADGDIAGDLMHLNDVEPLDPAMADEYPLFEAGDLLVSLRESDLVMVLDPGSGTVRWHASEPFVGQHDPDFTGGGWIGTFDNHVDGTWRGTLLGGSRIVSLQPHTDSMRIRFPTPVSEPLYTETGGKWQLLDNGNLLLTEARAGRVVEVDTRGRTVWEWIHEPFDTELVAEVLEGTRYPFSRSVVESWPCSPGGTPP